MRAARVHRPTDGHWRLGGQSGFGQQGHADRLARRVREVRRQAYLREDPVAALGEALAVLSVDRVVHRQA